MKDEDEDEKTLDRNFEWKVKKFQGDTMIIKLNLTSPLDISAGKNQDRLRLKMNSSVSELILFSDKLAILDKESHNLTHKIPPQVFDGRATRSAVASATGVKNLGKVLFVIGFILTLFMQESLEYMILFVRALQLVFHLAMLNIIFPSIVLMVIENIIPLVLFDVLENPYDIGLDSLIEFDEIPQEDIDEVIPPGPQMIGYQTTNYSLGMQSILFACSIVLLKLLMIIALELLLLTDRFKSSNYLREWSKSLKSQVMYGDAISIMNETFFEFIICGNY